MKRLERLRQQRDEKEARRAELRARDNGNLLADAQRQYDRLGEELDELNASIERESELDEIRRTAPAVEPVREDGPSLVTGRDRSRGGLIHTAGFSSEVEFLTRIRQAEGPGIVMDQRLPPMVVQDPKFGQAFMLPPAFHPRYQATAGSDEQGVYSAPHGGFAVQEQIVPGMLQLGFEGDPTVGRVQLIGMKAPTVKMLARVDKNHTTSVSGGFTVTRKPETVPSDASRAEIERITLSATGLSGHAFASWELLQDAPDAFPATIKVGFRDQFAHVKLGEKIRGLGGAEYLGVLNALDSNGDGPTIAITRNTTNEIRGEDILQARQQCWGYERAIWIANHDCYQDIASAVIIKSDGGASPVGGIAVRAFQPSMAEGRPDMLLGRPIFWSEYASTLGSSGDLILGVWSEYLEGIYLPLRGLESMHVRFLEREQTFLFWERNAGAPWWRSALTPKHSTEKLSPFVIIAA